MAGFLQAVGQSDLLGTAFKGLQGVAAIQGIEANKQTMAFNAFKMKQAAEEAARNNTPIDVGSLTSQYNIKDGPTKDMMLKMMDPYIEKGQDGKPMLSPTGNPIIRRGNLKEYSQFIHIPENAEQLGKAKLTELKAGWDQAEKELSDLGDNPNPKKLQEAQGKIAQSRAAYDAAFRNQQGLNDWYKGLTTTYGPAQADAIYRGQMKEQDAVPLKVQEAATRQAGAQAIETQREKAAMERTKEANKGRLDAAEMRKAGEKGKITEKDLLQLKKDKLKYIQKGIADFKAANPLGKITSETIDAERKRVSEEYDAGMGTQTGKPAPVVSKERDIKSLSSYFKGAKTKDAAIAMIKEAHGKGWTVEELKQAEKEAKWAW